MSRAVPGPAPRRHDLMHVKSDGTGFPSNTGPAASRLPFLPARESTIP